MNEILYTIVHNGLKYVVNTDHLCPYKLWIKVYDGDNMIANHFMWLLDKEGAILEDRFRIPDWKEAFGFRWSEYDCWPNEYYFPAEVQKKLDSYFKMKAFW